jgi:hypothetical protein
MRQGPTAFRGNLPTQLMSHLVTNLGHFQQSCKLLSISIFKEQNEKKPLQQSFKSRLQLQIFLQSEQ